jgi:hypothetical protein
MLDPNQLPVSAVPSIHDKTWALSLRNALRHVSHHHESFSTIGLVPAGPDSFFVHATTFAKFLGLKDRSSLNKDFQQHGFYIDTDCDIEELSRLCPQISPSPRCWVKRVFALGPFNGDISDQQAGIASNYAKQVRKGLAVTAPHLRNVHQDDDDDPWPNQTRWSDWDEFTFLDSDY